jgi:hypothetical protein
MIRIDQGAEIKDFHRERELETGRLFWGQSASDL